MDKKTPTYDLEAIKESVRENGARTTFSAKRSMTELHLVLDDVEKVVLQLNRSNFYKSMTTYKNHKLWQDVYHASYLGYELYVKFMVDDEGYLVVSFKEKGD